MCGGTCDFRGDEPEQHRGRLHLYFGFRVERERERERVCVSVCVRERERQRAREREKLHLEEAEGCRSPHLPDYSKVDMLIPRYKTDNFGAKRTSSRTKRGSEITWKRPRGVAVPISRAVRRANRSPFSRGAAVPRRARI